MALLEDRMVELTRQGVTYFKLDGLFGHLNLRDFELHGEKYGIPYMPQLGLEGIGTGDKALNDSKYGWDCHDNVLRLSLLRSPVWPDSLADRGRHHFRFAIYPHAGDWRAARTERGGKHLLGHF